MTPSPPRRRAWYLLLLLPYVALLWVPAYARDQPELWGFPFFYWYQFLWVLLGAGLTALVYLLARAPARLRRAPRLRARWPGGPRIPKPARASRGPRRIRDPRDRETR